MNWNSASVECTQAHCKSPLEQARAQLRQVRWKCERCKRTSVSDRHRVCEKFSNQQDLRELSAKQGKLPKDEAQRKHTQNGVQFWMGVLPAAGKDKRKKVQVRLFFRLSLSQ